MRKHHASAAAASLLCLTTVQATPASAPVHVEPCAIPGVSGPARCGTLQVWENRDSRKGRRIGIHFVVLPATAAARATEAVAFFSGGPGQAAIDSTAPVALQLAAVRDSRDLLFMDLRGTGKSNPLPCKSARPEDLQSYLKEFYTPADVSRCAEDLRSRADVTWYHSAPAVDDLDELRGALGYDRLDLFGVSYGTRAALVYLRRHPTHVRAVLMHGSVPTDMRYPLTVPRDAQIAIDGVFADCARDDGCKRAFPDLTNELKESLRRVEKGPVQAEVLDPRTGEMSTVLLARDRYTEGLRALLYDAGSSSLVPAIIHRAAHGDFGPAAEEELGWRMSLEEHSRGMHLAVTCAEDVDFIDPNEAARFAQGTFMTAWRAVDQKAACAVWPHRKLDASFLDPVRSRAPLLVMNGQYDPATALYHAERLVRGFPNGRVITIPSAGHGTGGLVGLQPCYDRIVADFIRTGDAKAVDESCVQRVHRGAFPAELPGGKVIAMAPEALVKFAGRYSGAEPMEIRMEKGKLYAVFEGRELMLLPTGPRRFRFAISPHTQITFRESDGAVTGFDLFEGGAPPDPYERIPSDVPVRQLQKPGQ